MNYAFSKSDFRGRVKFRFFPCFSSVACVVSCTRSPHSRRAERFLAQGRRIPDVLSVFLHFRTFCSRFRRILSARSYFTPRAPFRSVKICKRFVCESLWYALSKKTIFRPIPKHSRHAFSNRFFRTLNSPYTGTFSKKKIQTAKVDVLNVLYIARLL